MNPRRVAAWLDSYRVDLKDALRAATRDGYRLLEANAARGELNPREFGRSARRHLLRFLRDLGTELGAVCLEFPGRGLADRQFADERVDQFRRTLELCGDLQVRQAGVKLSGLDDERNGPLAREMLSIVAGAADRFGVAVAVHCGSDDPQTAVRLVRALGCPQIRVGLDTARAAGDVQAIARGADVVGAVHLRDVRRVGDRIEEVPLGQGEVDFPALLALLDAGGYRGSLVVRRDAPGPAVDAMRQAREYISSLVGRPA